MSPATAVPAASASASAAAAAEEPAADPYLALGKGLRSESRSSSGSAGRGFGRLLSRRSSSAAALAAAAGAAVAAAAAAADVSTAGSTSFSADISGNGGAGTAGGSGSSGRLSRRPSSAAALPAEVEAAVHAALSWGNSGVGSINSGGSIGVVGSSGSTLKQRRSDDGSTPPSAAQGQASSNGSPPLEGSALPKRADASRAEGAAGALAAPAAALPERSRPLAADDCFSFATVADPRGGPSALCRDAFAGKSPSHCDGNSTVGADSAGSGAAAAVGAAAAAGGPAALPDTAEAAASAVAVNRGPSPMRPRVGRAVAAVRKGPTATASPPRFRSSSSSSGGGGGAGGGVSGGLAKQLSRLPPSSTVTAAGAAEGDGAGVVDGNIRPSVCGSRSPLSKSTSKTLSKPTSRVDSDVLGILAHASDSDDASVVSMSAIVTGKGLPPLDPDCGSSDDDNDDDDVGKNGTEGLLDRRAGGPNPNGGASARHGASRRSSAPTSANGDSAQLCVSASCASSSSSPSRGSSRQRSRPRGHVRTVLQSRGAGADVSDKLLDHLLHGPGGGTGSPPAVTDEGKEWNRERARESGGGLRSRSSSSLRTPLLGGSGSRSPDNGGGGAGAGGSRVGGRRGPSTRRSPLRNSVEAGERDADEVVADVGRVLQYPRSHSESSLVSDAVAGSAAEVEGSGASSVSGVYGGSGGSGAAAKDGDKVWDGKDRDCSDSHAVLCPGSPEEDEPHSELFSRSGVLVHRKAGRSNAPASASGSAGGPSCIGAASTTGQLLSTSSGSSCSSSSSNSTATGSSTNGGCNAAPTGLALSMLSEQEASFLCNVDKDKEGEYGALTTMRSLKATHSCQGYSRSSTTNAALLGRRAQSPLASASFGGPGGGEGGDGRDGSCRRVTFTQDAVMGGGFSRQKTCGGALAAPIPTPTASTARSLSLRGVKEQREAASARRVGVSTAAAAKGAASMSYEVSAEQAALPISSDEGDVGGAPAPAAAAVAATAAAAAGAAAGAEAAAAAAAAATAETAATGVLAAADGGLKDEEEEKKPDAQEEEEVARAVNMFRKSQSLSVAISLFSRFTPRPQNPHPAAAAAATASVTAAKGVDSAAAQAPNTQVAADEDECDARIRDIIGGSAAKDLQRPSTAAAGAPRSRRTLSAEIQESSGKVVPGGRSIGMSSKKAPRPSKSRLCNSFAEDEFCLIVEEFLTKPKGLGGRRLPGSVSTSAVTAAAGPAVAAQGDASGVRMMPTSASVAAKVQSATSVGGVEAGGGRLSSLFAFPRTDKSVACDQT